MNKSNLMNLMNLMNLISLITLITYNPPVKPEVQAQGCILRRSMVFNLLGDDSPVRVLAIISLLME